MELPILNDIIECSCEDCTSACRRKPGWFVPEEIKPAADLLGLTEQEFFDKYISVDYWGNPMGSAEDFMFVLAPATDKSEPGKEYPLDPSGQCVFLKEGKCSIHGAKPYECKIYDHRNVNNLDGVHQAVAESWQNTDKIKELLGREPNVEPPNILDAMQFMLDSLRDMSLYGRGS